MEIGLGLPAAVPGARADQIVEWARRAEARGFSSLSALDRLGYDNYEPLVSLAAAAAVTERITLATSVLLLPLHSSAALLAKQVASLDRLSGGRLTLGLGVGAREDDYRLAGTPFSDRGRRFEVLLQQMQDAWAGEDVGPEPPKGPPSILIGGRSERAFDRAARFGDGWIAGSADVDTFRRGREMLRAAWARHGRVGAPRALATSYVALGPHADRRAGDHLRHYYAFTGDRADAIARSALTTPDAVRAVVAELAEAGCDELVLHPCDPDPGQVDLLADVLMHA
jgi:alkanesulfonate monooxygenase SsuD/methylene tetrahydromethanopterin reductase-like flavin-dependent oxidoreductase (luciferase family)